MQPTDDGTLLRQYAEDHSDEAFAALVTRYINLVYSVALRYVGDPHQAEEISQAVFIILAKKAAQLRHDRALSSWLFQTTRLTASNFVRSEGRRHRREEEAHMQSVLNESASDIWPRIEPFLDDAVAALSETDRHAIVLRFYEGRTLREVGAVLGASEDAAEKRVSRAVERLRAFFAKRGVTVGTGGLVVVISANAVQAAPVGLTAAISTAALAGTTIAATATATVTKAVAMTTLQKTLVTATVAVLAGAGIYEARQASKLRDQNQTLQQQQAPLADQIGQLTRERDEAARQISALREDNERLNRNTAELLKLRGEVTRLRKEVEAGGRASKDRLSAQNLHPLIEQVVSNTLPVQTYSATTRAIVNWNQVVVTGGWKTPSGKRTVVFAVPKHGDDSAQLTIETRIVEFPEDTAKKLGLDQLNTDSKEANSSVILTPDQYEAVLKATKDSEEITILGEPSVTTVSGRQAQIQGVDLKTGPSGEKYSVGPVVDFMPTISADGKSVDLEIVANLNYPSPSTSR